MCQKACNAKVLKEGRGAGGQAPEQGRNGKVAVSDAKPRGLEGDWRAAKEKSAADQDRHSLDGAHQNYCIAVEGRAAWHIWSCKTVFPRAVHADRRGTGRRIPGRAHAA